MLHADRAVPPSTPLVHRFRLESLLGRGGCGEVHAAYDLLHERRVALKLLRPDGVDPDVEESLRSEFRVLRSLAHPGIVQVFDFGYAGELPFYTMELFEGVDLASAPDDIDPHALLESVARALDYLHTCGLVHSDLKPSNVFRVGPDQFKLTDFGLVGRLRDTRREAPYGTLAYMPPERLQGHSRRPDPREDLYALGALLYERLVGRPPFVGATPEETLARIAAGDLDAELAPVPEPWTRLLRRLLATDPGQRIASAWEVLQTWSTFFDRPGPVPQTWPAPFVGRRRELALIRAALSETARRRGAFFFVTGQPGFGKSALLEAAAAQVVSAGVPVWRCDAPASPRPLALAERLATLYGRWQAGLPAEAADAAARLASWAESMRAARDEEGQLNVLAHALDDVRIVAGAAPHVLIVDDAHRLDHASRTVLRFLAQGARDTGLVLLVGGRSSGTGTDVADSGDVLLADLQLARRNGASVEVLHLRELGREEVGALVRRRLGPDLDHLAERIYDLTSGHPFFVTEALQHLLLTGQLRRHAQGWSLAPLAERRLLPRMADTILSDHIGAMRPEDRDLYQVLALFPSGAEADVLGQVVGAGDREIAAALERGVRGGLLVQRAGTYRFVHELIREACAARCPTPTARRLHRSIADTLPGTPAEAHHRFEAGEASPLARACFLREARSYDTRRAPVEALRFYEAALDIDPQSPDAEELGLRVAVLRLQVGRAEDAASLLLQRLVTLRPPLLRARYLHRLGECSSRQGRNDEALLHMQAAAELMHEHAQPEERLHFTADLCRVLLARGDSATVVTTCQAALEEFALESATERAALLLLQAQAERMGGDYAAAEETCRTTLEVLKPLGRTLALAQTYTQIGTNYTFRRDFEQAEKFYRAALKVHTELGDLNGMKNAYNNLGMAQTRADRPDEAIRSYEQSLELKRRLGDRPGEGNSLNNLGNLWELRGEHRRAFQCYRRGICLYRRLSRPRELAILYNNMGEVYIRLGRFHRAQRLLKRAQAHCATLGGAYITQVIGLNFAETQLTLLEFGPAIETLNGALQMLRRSGPAHLLPPAHAFLARAYALADDTQSAFVHERQALESMTADLEDESRLDVLLSLAETAWQQGRAEACEFWAREAEEVAQSAGRPHSRVRALRLLASTHEQRGDWDVAEKLLAEAMELCRAWGFRYELAKCYKCSGKLHWEIGLRSQAEDDFQQCIQLLDGLGLRAEQGLTYLELARLSLEPGT